MGFEQGAFPCEAGSPSLCCRSCFASPVWWDTGRSLPVTRFFLQESSIWHLQYPSIRSKTAGWFECKLQIWCQVCHWWATGTDVVPFSTVDLSSGPLLQQFRTGTAQQMLLYHHCSRTVGARLEQKTAQVASFTTHAWERELEISGLQHNSLVSSS